LRIDPDIWPQYAQRPETRREHLAELQAWLNLKPFAIADYRRFVYQLAELAQQTDRGIVLAETLVELLRQQRIIMPAVDVIERVCSEALTRGTRQVYEALTAPLSDHHRRTSSIGVPMSSQPFSRLNPINFLQTFVTQSLELSELCEPDKNDKPVNKIEQLG